MILAYWTAEAGANGEVMFREDVYERDAAVLSALDGRGPIRVVYRAPAKPDPAAARLPKDQNAIAPAEELENIEVRHFAANERN